MKARLNITIEENLLIKMKHYARRHHTSVSEIVENYLLKLAQPAGQKNIIDLVEGLTKPDISDTADLKELYYKERGE